MNDKTSQHLEVVNSLITQSTFRTVSIGSCRVSLLVALNVNEIEIIVE